MLDLSSHLKMNVPDHYVIGKLYKILYRKVLSVDIYSKIKLNNGVEIPVLGFGTYLVNSGDEAITAVDCALQAGYRHIDTAALYGNETEIGEVVKHSSIHRSELFITTKVWNSDQGYSNTLKAFERSLNNLKMDYADLYLVHWPLPGKRKETWEALLRLYDEKLCLAIGVSNYTIKHLEELLNTTPIVPAVNQVEFSLYLYQKELQEFCESKGIIMESYSPLTRGKKFNEPKLKALAVKYGKTPAQILIRWALQVGTVTLPKSSSPARIRENIGVFDFCILDEDMLEMAGFNDNFRVAWDPSELP